MIELENNEHLAGGSVRSWETEEEEEEEGDNGKSGSSDTKVHRLEKNRESARESRKRKKNYIQTLEQTAEKLQQEVDDLKRGMEVAREKEKMAYLSHLDSVDQLLHGR